MKLLEQADIYLEGFGIPKIPESFRIIQEMGHHAQLTIRIWVEKEESDSILGRISYGKPIILKDKKLYSKPLFCGIIDKAHLGRVKGRLTAELEVYSCSYEMDREQKDCSYQKKGRTKRELVALLLSKYDGAYTWDSPESNDAAGEFLMQYHETDWEFLKRIASKDGCVIFPELCVPRAEIYIGLPQNREITKLTTKGYNRHSYMDGDLGQTEYIVQGCYENIPIGNPVHFLGLELYVYKKDSYLDRGLVYHDYALRPASSYNPALSWREKEIRNPQMVGAAIPGTVLGSNATMTQLALSTDIEGEDADSWHTRAVYYSGKGKGYSGRPEVGDVQYVYFPDMDESNRYIIGGSGADFEILSGMIQEVVSRQTQTDRKAGEEAKGVTEKSAPKNKNWGTPCGQNMSLSDTGVHFSTSGKKGRLELTGKGIDFSGKNNIRLKGETINLRGKNVIIESQMYTSIEAEPSAIAVLPSEIHMKATDIKIESPLNQAVVVEQPPIEEILQKIEEAKKKALPLFEADGSSIKREGYGDILDSDELYLYFVENFYGKPGRYENYENQPETDIYDKRQPVMTVYETWLSDVYGKTALEKAADYFTTLDGFQTMLGMLGFAFPVADLVNCVISLGRGNFGDAVLDAIGAIPLFGDIISFGAKVRKGSKIVTELKYVYKVMEGVDTTSDSVKGIMAALDVAEGVKHGADTIDSVADVKKVLKDINGLEKLAEDARTLDNGISGIKQLDHISDGIETIEKTVNPIRKSTDTIDNVSDAIKTTNKATEGAEATVKGNKVTKYVHKGEEVSSDLKISTEIIDNDGKVLDTIIYENCSANVKNSKTKWERNGYKFSAHADAHLNNLEGFDKRHTGIKGAHNILSFAQFERPIKVIGNVRYSKIEGIFEIDYTVAKMDRGKPIGWLNVQYVKTLFDPHMVSVNDLRRWAEEAFENADVISAKQNQLYIYGTANNGLKFEGWIDITTKEITSYYPVLKWSNK